MNAAPTTAAAECSLAGGLFELAPLDLSNSSTVDGGSTTNDDTAPPPHIAQSSVVSYLRRLHAHSSSVYFVFGCGAFRNDARWACDIPHGRITKRIRIAVLNSTSSSHVTVRIRTEPLLDSESVHMQKQRRSGKLPSSLLLRPCSNDSNNNESSPPQEYSSSDDDDDDDDNTIGGQQSLANEWTARIAPNEMAQVELEPIYRSTTPFVIRAELDGQQCFEWFAQVLHRNNNLQKSSRPDYRVPSVCRARSLFDTPTTALPSPSSSSSMPTSTFVQQRSTIQLLPTNSIVRTARKRTRDQSSYSNNDSDEATRVKRFCSSSLQSSSTHVHVPPPLPFECYPQSIDHSSMYSVAPEQREIFDVLDEFFDTFDTSSPNSSDEWRTSSSSSSSSSMSVVYSPDTITTDSISTLLCELPECFTDVPSSTTMSASDEMSFDSFL